MRASGDGPFQTPSARCSGVRPPRSRGQQLDLLRGDERAEFQAEALDEVLVGVYRGPVRAPVGIVIEFPEIDELIDHAGSAWKYPISFLSWPPFWSAG